MKTRKIEWQTENSKRKYSIGKLKRIGGKVNTTLNFDLFFHKRMAWAQKSRSTTRISTQLALLWQRCIMCMMGWIVYARTLSQIYFNFTRDCSRHILTFPCCHRIARTHLCSPSWFGIFFVFATFSVLLICGTFCNMLFAFPTMKENKEQNVNKSAINRHHHVIRGIIIKLLEWMRCRHLCSHPLA